VKGVEPCMVENLRFEMRETNQQFKKIATTKILHFEN
jgi:hypothetical protein